MSVGSAFVFVCIGILIAGVVFGTLPFSALRTAAVKAEESGDPDQIDHVIEKLTEQQHKFIPARRSELDRHPYYIGNHAGVLFLSLGLIFGKIPHGTALSGISPLLQHALAAEMCVAAFIGLTGTALGRWIVLDNRLPYTLGIGASLGVMVGMGSYGLLIASRSDLIGTLGGGLALSITVSSFWMVPRLWREIRSLSKLRDRIADREFGQ